MYFDSCRAIASKPLFNNDIIMSYCFGNGPHTTGKIHLSTYNQGVFGGFGFAEEDDITGKTFGGMRYPYYSDHTYLGRGELWVGAVVGRDTLVSGGLYEYLPPSCPEGKVIKRSIEKTSKYYSKDARAEEEYEMVFADTAEDSYFHDQLDFVEGRPHKPIGIIVTEKSYSWSYDYADDFVIMEYSVKSINRNLLRDVYIGIYIAPGVTNIPQNQYEPFDGVQDDYVGYLKTYPSNSPCPGSIDTVDLAYFIDNDGFPNESGEFDRRSPCGGCAIRLLQLPADNLDFNYNWWVGDHTNIANDWGPRMFETEGNPFRYMNGYFATPHGDRNMYYVMSNGEFDYDQITAYQNHEVEGYIRPTRRSYDIAKGASAGFLLSFGPYDLYLGETINFAFAVVCGENVHRDPNHYAAAINPLHPDAYYQGLDFSDLANNARWAKWIYDNPGYDTDGDGYYGEIRYCCKDSVLNDNGDYECTKSREYYISGDGVPDIRAAAPPPPPEVRLAGSEDNPLAGKLTVRWNGLDCETTIDPFSGEYDFEGYRVYMALSEDENDFNLICSYDKVDYSRWRYDSDYNEWILTELPFTLDSLKSIYGQDFDPRDFDLDHIMTAQDEEGQMASFYFTPQDENNGEWDDATMIHKVYPDQPYPSTLNLDSAKMYYPEELTEEGYLKYFEYEYTINNLLISLMYYVSVTTFDYGAPGLGLTSLETDPTVNYVGAYPQSTADKIAKQGLKVIVYPNPYRADGNYRENKYEGRGQEDMPDFRVRALHFTNLPRQCTIRIFSIDGDLIRVIEHDCPADDPNAGHDIWDLITRNTQEPVSGIYYYSVESKWGNDIGKFVLIM